MRAQRSNLVHVEVVVLAIGLLALTASLLGLVCCFHIYREFWVIFWSLGTFGWISAELCLIALPSFRALRIRFVLQVLLLILGTLDFGAWLSIWVSFPSYSHAALALTRCCGIDMG